MEIRESWGLCQAGREEGFSGCSPTGSEPEILGVISLKSGIHLSVFYFVANSAQCSLERRANGYG
jgi:hypothetical protein